jgi:acyl-CoA thioester hydrolase
MSNMQLSNRSAMLLHALTPRTYVTLRRFLRQAKLLWASWRRRQRLTEDIGAYPIRSTEKLRFADTDCNGHISNAVLAVCCQNARMEVLFGPSRAPVPDGAHFVIARVQLDFLAEMHWPGTVESGTRVEQVGRSSIVLAQVLLRKDRYVARAKFIVVLIDAARRRATQLPPVLIDALYEIGQHGLHNRFSDNFRLGNAIKGILVRL